MEKNKNKIQSLLKNTLISKKFIGNSHWIATTRKINVAVWDKFIKQCLNEKKINEKENKGKIIKGRIKERTNH